ncbi:uncharacterized protein LOC106642922 [Copidosoma floridanum]|uniref:uncharacterized protein LOC106642922 n=1 Tax=Copidosoma floridanum TaxID=29053 RepID=UPI0006C941B7|nr:uncharacterized protein LOC106642922 [Copidosoma floridanum]
MSSCVAGYGGGDEEPAVTKSRPVTCDLESELPDGTAFLVTQVAGHPFDVQKKKTGMLQGPNGRVLKPIVKPVLGEREIAFYENLQISGNPTDMEIQRHTPLYHGTKEMRIFNKRIKFLELENITEGMIEPCLIDIKIGRRTWDPLATPEKRISEEVKYAESKAAYGFCITGFQVYRIPSGNLERFDKVYGKNLDATSVVKALELFLNGTSTKPPCRELVLRLLSNLWKIQSLFRVQRRYRLFSSSLLIAYDAKCLRQQLALRQLNNSYAESVLRVPFNRCKSFSGGRSLNSINQVGKLGSPAGVNSRPESPRFETLRTTGEELSPVRPSSPKSESPTRSPRLNRAIDRLQRLKRSISLQSCEVSPDKTINTDYGKETHYSDSNSPKKRFPDVQVPKLCRTHSYSNNFDADIIEMKEDYANLLSELSANSNGEDRHDWARVSMIDFAHVFPAEDSEIDENYLEGIDNLIKIFEEFIA